MFGEGMPWDLILTIGISGLIWGINNGKRDYEITFHPDEEEETSFEDSLRS
ncbi:MAG: hypothetical protein AAGH79_02910 [Bacteroidota bacterium]